MASYARVSREEVVLLVLGFLKDERDAFPDTLRAFLAESGEIMGSVKSADRHVKSLCTILVEYVDLKKEKQQRDNLVASFRNDPIAADNVAKTMANMTALFEDYHAARESRILHDGTLAAAAGRQRGGAPAADATVEALTNVQAQVHQASAQQQQQPGSARRQLEIGGGGGASPGRSSKRRKETPTHWNGKAHNQRSSSATSSPSKKNSSHGEQHRSSQGGQGGREGEEELPEPRTMFTEISESVLSDPQVSQLLLDTTTMDELFSMLEGENFDSLVEPLTKHINTVLGSGGGGGGEGGAAQSKGAAADEGAPEPSAAAETGESSTGAGRHRDAEAPVATAESAKSDARLTVEAAADQRGGGEGGEHQSGSQEDASQGEGGPVFPQDVDIDKFLQRLHAKPAS